MRHIRQMRHRIRSTFIYSAIAILTAGLPLSSLTTARAEEVAPVSTTSTAQTTPPPQHTYTYNSDTNHWDTEEWQYDSGSGTYTPKQVTQGPLTPPATPETTGVHPAGETISPLASPGDPQAATVLSQVDGTANTSVQTEVSATNDIVSTSLSGDAAVTNNTTAGDATSGDANASATAINVVHSTVGGDTASVAHFEANITGDVVGDITFYPMVEGALASSTNNLVSNTNIDTNLAVTNNLDLAAGSGDAAVTNNTTAGDATSGDANAVANVVNLINSIVAANQSFVGTINIYGNLDGDILVSPNFIPQLLAKNSGSTTIDNSLTASLDANLNDSQSIINNISLGAVSGSAVVDNNTRVGSASSGQAQTNLTVLNLTGREVVASNSLLVFVNVLGKWVGMIVDAPGSTAAAFGNGVITNTTNLNSQINANSNGQITNNINLAAASGNATVTNNTSAGNATTGDATASANIANISMSTFQVTDWFGVLFINVFGEWYGSFGIDTANGTIVPLETEQTTHSDALPKIFKVSLTPTSSTQPYSTAGFGAAFSGTTGGTGAVNIVKTAASTEIAKKARGMYDDLQPTRGTTRTYSNTFAYVLMAGGALTIAGPAIVELITRRRGRDIA